MIRRLYVHNFRCLENFDLSLDGASSVLLLGKNGAGKTTVGVALEHLQRMARGINRVGDLVKPSDLSRGRTEVPMRFELEVVLEEETYVYSIAFEFPPGFRELRVLDEKLQVAGRPVFTRELADVRIPREGSTAEVVFRIDWHVVALPVVQERSTHEPLSIFKTWLGNMLILRPVPSLFSGISGGQGSRPVLIEPAKVNIGDWFTELTGAEPELYSRFSDHLSEIMPEFTKVSNWPTGRGTKDLIFHFAKGADKLELGLDQLSDGEKCYVLQALVIASSAIRKPLLCFWDEPDNFLAPDEVGQSIMSLRRAFRDQGQIIVTSHNPETIRRFSEENTFYLTRRSRLEPTTYKTVEDLRRGGDYSGSFLDAVLRGEIGASVGH